MATERLSMRKTREILRLKWTLGKSHRQVAASLHVGVGTVSELLARARTAGLQWSGAEQLTDDELEAKLYPASSASTRTRPLPSPLYLLKELKKVGVTLTLLHEEYLEQHPDGYGYTQFCRHYDAWLSRQRLVMRQQHRAGEKLFVDYSGKKPRIVDPRTGEPVEVELFVAVFGASNYTYAEATLTQQSPDWISSHVHALAYFGGVPGALVPDQLRSGVSAPCRYEPRIQSTYDELARHYGTAVVPARPGKSRDKAKVEAGVLVAQRWILARLRNQTFFSLDELNERIAELLEDLNTRVMKGYGASRRDLFETIDRPALRPLPPERFVYGEWKHAKVNIDYHIDVEHHYYSLHHGLVHEHVDVWLTATTVEIFRRGVRLDSYPRSYVRGGFSTRGEHMPSSHREHAEWTPTRLIDWAAKAGPQTEALARAIIAERPHPEHGYRSCLGLMRLGRKYGHERLEAASGRALAVGARSYKSVAAMLKAGLDRLPPLDATKTKSDRTPVAHDNIRGPRHYQ
jgi:transposase